MGCSIDMATTLPDPLRVPEGEDKSNKDKFFAENVEWLRVWGKDYQANGLNNWERVIGEGKQHPDIDGAAPYLHAEGMLTKDNLVNGVIIRGVLPNEEINVAVVADKMVSGSLSNLEAGKFNIILGSELVRNLGIKIGDKVIR